MGYSQCKMLNWFSHSSIFALLLLSCCCCEIILDSDNIAVADFVNNTRLQLMDLSNQPAPIHSLSIVGMPCNEVSISDLNNVLKDSKISSLSFQHCYIIDSFLPQLNIDSLALLNFSIINSNLTAKGICHLIQKLPATLKSLKIVGFNQDETRNESERYSFSLSKFKLESVWLEGLIADVFDWNDILMEIAECKSIKSVSIPGNEISGEFSRFRYLSDTLKWNAVDVSNNQIDYHNMQILLKHLNLSLLKSLKISNNTSISQYLFTDTVFFSLTSLEFSNFPIVIRTPNPHSVPFPSLTHISLSINKFYSNDIFPDICNIFSLKSATLQMIISNINNAYWRSTHIEFLSISSVSLLDFFISQCKKLQNLQVLVIDFDISSYPYDIGFFFKNFQSLKKLSILSNCKRFEFESADPFCYTLQFIEKHYVNGIESLRCQTLKSLSITFESENGTNIASMLNDISKFPQIFSLNLEFYSCTLNQLNIVMLNSIKDISLKFVFTDCTINCFVDKLPSIEKITLYIKDSKINALPVSTPIRSLKVYNEDISAGDEFLDWIVHIPTLNAIYVNSKLLTFSSNKLSVTDFSYLLSHLKNVDKFSSIKKDSLLISMIANDKKALDLIHNRSSLSAYLQPLLELVNKSNQNQKAVNQRINNQNGNLSKQMKENAAVSAKLNAQKYISNTLIAKPLNSPQNLSQRTHPKIQSITKKEIDLSCLLTISISDLLKTQNYPANISGYLTFLKSCIEIYEIENIETEFISLCFEMALFYLPHNNQNQNTILSCYPLLNFSYDAKKLDKNSLQSIGIIVSSSKLSGMNLAAMKGNEKLMKLSSIINSTYTSLEINEKGNILSTLIRIFFTENMNLREIVSSSKYQARDLLNCYDRFFGTQTQDLLLDAANKQLSPIDLTFLSLAIPSFDVTKFNDNVSPSLTQLLEDENESDAIKEFSAILRNPIDLTSTEGVFKNVINLFHPEDGLLLKQCSICLYLLPPSQQTNFIHEGVATFHSFHMKCIKPWLQNNQTCPDCRQKGQLENK